MEGRGEEEEEEGDGEPARERGGGRERRELGVIDEGNNSEINYM